MKAWHVVPVLVASALGGAVAQAGPDALNPDAFNLSAALDRPVAPTQRALEIVVGGGYTQGVGGAGSAGNIEDVTGPGGTVAIEVGVRATPRLAIALYGTLARFRHGDAIADGSRAQSATAGIQAAWHTRESRSIDPWISVGAGWRGLWLMPKDMAESSVHGVELVRLQLGIDYRFTPWLAIAPVIGLSASLFLVENTGMASELTKVQDNRLNLYGFTGVLGRFDLGG